MKKIFVTLFLVPIVSFGAPKWISKIYNNGLCDSKKEICAVGEAESLNGAKRSATVEILKFFKTEVKSEFKTTLSNMNGEIYESASDSVEEIVEGTIQGIEFKKTDEDNLGYYALAVLNKKKAARILEKEIKDLDEQIKASLSSTDQKSVVTIEENFIERELLYSKFQLLTSKKIQRPISYKELRSMKKNMVKGIVVKLETTGEAKKIKGLLLKGITSIGYKVSNENFNRKVIANVKSEKLHLNVDGFVKYKYDVEIISYNGSKNTSTLSESFIEVGRSKKDAEEKISSKIKKYLDENLKQLAIN